jgi:biotin transport system ATP-binding protein
VPVIEARDVSHRYGDRVVLRDVDVRITEQRVGVVGANGSGKSTFARLVNGLVLPTAGRVRVDGLDTRTDGRAVRRRVGFCFTDPDAQIVMPTVAEDVAFGLRRRGLSRAQSRTRVRDALAAYGLTEHADHPAHLLSGGQK